MDTQSLYYIKKYNNLIEQINRLKHENNLLEELASGLGSDSTSIPIDLDTDDPDTDDSDTDDPDSIDPDPSNPSNPSDPEEPSNPQNPPIETPYDLNRPRGTSIRDIASLSNRNFVSNFGL